jgi:hypothetical protein
LIGHGPIYRDGLRAARKGLCRISKYVLTRVSDFSEKQILYSSDVSTFLSTLKIY